MRAAQRRRTNERKKKSTKRKIRKNRETSRQINIASVYLSACSSFRMKFFLSWFLLKSCAKRIFCFRGIFAPIKRWNILFSPWVQLFFFFFIFLFFLFFNAFGCYFYGFSSFQMKINIEITLSFCENSVKSVILGSIECWMLVFSVIFCCKFFFLFFYIRCVFCLFRR